MMMTDREKLIELIRDGRGCPEDHDMFSSCYGCKYDSVADCDVKRLADYLLANGVTFVKDTNDGSKQIHAHWIINGDWAECSNCHESSKIAVLEHKDFCGACGAAMDEESVVIHP